MVAFAVTRESQSFVAPAAPPAVEPAEVLELSAIDRVPGLRHNVRSLHLFRHNASGRGDGGRPAEVIRAALSRALAEYPPFAGRFTGSVAAGDACIACTGDGAWFVEAAVDCTLDDVNGLDHPLMISEGELLPSPEEGVDPASIPVMMQVTEFTCGGFVVGLVSVHTLADGLGAAQFINSVAELARGMNKPTVTPVWARAVVPNPPSKLSPGAPLSFQSFDFQHFTADITSDRIAHVKSQYFQAMGHHCSTFDVAVAKIWQARTRAIKHSPDEQVHLCFFANTRHLLAQVLPNGGAGFYGNCFFPVTVTAAAGDVAAAGLPGVVKMIRDGKARLPSDFAKWATGDVEADPYQLTFEHNMLFVSDWTRLGFSEVDYGWCKPSYIVPFMYVDNMAVAILRAPPVPMKGTTIMLLHKL